MNFNEIAAYIIERLKNYGIVIQRYDAYSSKSIYLKLDYGVLNSIRISDHKGKKHLKYRYNVLSVCKEPIVTRTKCGIVRYYFPVNELDLLVRKIVYDRTQKMNRMKPKNYIANMEQAKEANKNTRGFWEKARIV